jgi:hypothetical protein
MYDLLHTFTPDSTHMICSVRDNYPRQVGVTESARRPSSLEVGCLLLSDNIMKMMMMMITLHIVRCNWFEENRRLDKRLTKENEDWLSTSPHLSYLSSQSHSLGNCLLDDENITWILQRRNVKVATTNLFANASSFYLLVSKRICFFYLCGFETAGEQRKNTIIHVTSGISLYVLLLKIMGARLAQYSVWLRAGRPGDRGPIPGGGKGFFL